MPELHPVIQYLFENVSNPDVLLRMTLFHVGNSLRVYLSRCVPIPRCGYSYYQQKCPWCGEHWYFHDDAIWIYSNLGARPAPQVGYVSKKFYVAMIQPCNLSGTLGWIECEHCNPNLAGFFNWLLQRAPTLTTLPLVRRLLHDWRRIVRQTRVSTSLWNSLRRGALKYAHERWVALFKNRQRVEVMELLEIGDWEPKPHPTRYPVLVSNLEHSPPDTDDSASRRQRV